MDTRLQEFIAHARSRNMDLATIRLLLLSAGWRERDILQSLSAESLSMPVPLPADRGGAREAFFHLLSFASLYTTVVSLIVLFFTYLNERFPDPALESQIDPTQYFGTIHWSMAAVIATFPLFLWMSWLLLKEMRHAPEKAASPIRRWLTYLTLFVAAMAMIGDMTTLLYNLLQGELSVRFILKVLVVFVLAGLSFTYYFVSLRTIPEKVETEKRRFHSLFAAAAVLIVLIALVWGFVLTGSPMSERERRFDERRVQDFQVISSEVQSIVYEGEPWTPSRVQKQPIPKTLQSVSVQARQQAITQTDPETGLPYEYSVKDAKHYTLCATFHTQSAEPYNIFWNHPSGHYCYQFDITDPEGQGGGAAVPVPSAPVLKTTPVSQ